MVIIWNIDLMYIDVSFKIKYFMVFNVIGIFGVFEGKVEMEGDLFENVKFNFFVDINFINMNNGDCDNYLKSGEFFDVEQFFKMIFEFIFFEKNGDDF